MDDREQPSFQGVFEPRELKILVQKNIALVEMGNRLELGLDIRQGGKALRGLSETSRKHPRGRGQGTRIGEIEPGGDGQGILLDQELLTVVQRRHRDGPKRTVWHEDQRGDGKRRQGRFKRPNQPVIEPLRMLEILPRGAVFESLPKGLDFLGDTIRTDRYGKSSQL